MTLRTRKHVGTVRVTMDFRLMRNHSDTAFELEIRNDDEEYEILLAGHGMNSIHDQLTIKFVHAGIDNFTIEVIKS